MADDIIMEVLSEGEVLEELFRLPVEYEKICTQKEEKVEMVWGLHCVTFDHMCAIVELSHQERHVEITGKPFRTWEELFFWRQAVREFQENEARRNIEEGERRERIILENYKRRIAKMNKDFE